MAESTRLEKSLGDLPLLPILLTRHHTGRGFLSLARVKQQSVGAAAIASLMFVKVIVHLEVRFNVLFNVAFLSGSPKSITCCTNVDKICGCAKEAANSGSPLRLWYTLYYFNHLGIWLQGITFKSMTMSGNSLVFKTNQPSLEITSMPCCSILWS